MKTPDSCITPKKMQLSSSDTVIYIIWYNCTYQTLLSYTEPLLQLLDANKLVYINLALQLSQTHLPAYYSIITDLLTNGINSCETVSDNYPVT